MALNSDDIALLDPEMQERVEEFIAHCKSAQFGVLLYSGRRSFEDQARLFRQGRSMGSIKAKAAELRDKWQRPDLADILIGVGPQKGKKIVTNAGPGQSDHNYGGAVDGVPMVGGKPVWGTDSYEDKEVWHQYGMIAISAGLEWAGNWTSFREYPHLKLPSMDWRELIKDSEYEL